MIVHAFAKLNLALEVGPRRADGYHDLVTVFQSIALADELVIEEAESLSLVVEGDAPGGPDNLVMRAATRLAARGGVAPRAAIRLGKRIPPGGGLGGGSSDAAATLVGLDRLWRLAAAPEDLYALAGGLGADVPYFLLGGTALGLGRGERLFPVAELPPLPVVLALSGTAVSTAAMFHALDEQGGVRSPPSSSRWRYPRIWEWMPGAFDGFENDFEAVVFARHPELGRIRESIAAAGAMLARLTGTGGTVYGVYRDTVSAAIGARRVRDLGVAAVLSETIDRARCRTLHQVTA